MVWAAISAVIADTKMMTNRVWWMFFITPPARSAVTREGKNSLNITSVLRGCRQFILKASRAL
jgi:hypothetical protein